jgi:hypothetical protein
MKFLNGSLKSVTGIKKKLCIGKTNRIEQTWMTILSNIDYFCGILLKNKGYHKRL